MAWKGTVWLGKSHRKSDGWHWQRTRLSTPERVERHRLVLAIATRVTVNFARPPDDDLPRVQSLFAQGCHTILRRVWRGRPLHGTRFRPRPWPTSFPTATRSNSRRSPTAPHKNL